MRGSSKGHPILRLTLSAVDVDDEMRLQTALDEIVGRDPQVSTNPQSGERLYNLEGNTESELESICARLRDEYHLAINVGPFQAILLQTVGKQAEAEGKYIRQIGGSGNYGHCKLLIEPNEPGKGYEFINEITGTAFPIQYIEPINQGVQSAMALGILAGVPVVDVKVRLCGGSYHEADSNEMAFEIAGSIAFKDAAKKASPVLLEPMIAIELQVPLQFCSAVRKHIYSRRGRVEREVAEELSTEISAVVPLSELLASAPRLLAEPRRNFVGYEPVRDNRSPDESRRV